jgi:predicted TIM-barrel fold metal-dependent hydrolase
MGGRPKAPRKPLRFPTGFALCSAAIFGCASRGGGADGGFATAPSTPREAAPEARAGGVVDTHLHISPTEIERLRSIMDEVGMSWGLNLSGMWPGGPLEEQLEAARRSGRLLVAANLPWALARRTKEFPEVAVELLRQSKSLGARALKVEKVLGLRAKKYDGTLLKVDDPWLDPIWEAAGKLQLPVVIHVGDPKAFWLPVDPNNERLDELTAHPRWSNYGIRDLPSFDELLAALMRVVAKHPETTFVSVHFGNNSEDPDWVARMLDENKNLYVDLAARLPEIGRPSHDPKRLHELFVRHADRILFGTDTGVSEENELMLGSFGKEPNARGEVGPYFQKHWRFLETWDRDIPTPTPIQGRWNINGIGLPEEALVLIYRGNATRLFGPPPAGHPPTIEPKAPPVPQRLR